MLKMCEVLLCKSYKVTYSFYVVCWIAEYGLPVKSSKCVPPSEPKKDKQIVPCHYQA